MQRKPIAGLHYSVERYFSAVRAALPDDIDATVFVAPTYSTGVVGRLRTALAVRRLRADVVHVTGDIHFAAIGRRRKGTVLTVLDCGFLRGASATAAAVYQLLWMRMPAKHAERIVAISSSIADEFASNSGADRGAVDVIPVSVGDDLVPLPAASNAKPVVLCFAQTENKNFARCMEALTGLDVHVHVVGLHAAGDIAALMTSGLTHTRSVDLDDAAMRDAYAQADVVLFPSTYEGFGMPIVEAQATGRPVITSDRAPMNETAGDGACLVDPESGSEIRAAVERVLTDAAYRNALVAAGLVNRERFRPEMAARAYAQIYREVAKRT